MKNLRTLVLTKCYDLPFILALNPGANSSEVVPCPNLEDLVLYVESRDQFHFKPLISMAKKRGLRDAKLSSIVIVDLGELRLGKEVAELTKYITRVEYVGYVVDNIVPDWDNIPGVGVNKYGKFFEVS